MTNLFLQILSDFRSFSDENGDVCLRLLHPFPSLNSGLLRDGYVFSSHVVLERIAVAEKMTKLGLLAAVAGPSLPFPLSASKSHCGDQCS